MTNPMSLEGHNVIVTGAAQGIGEAVARLAAELGAREVPRACDGNEVAQVAKLHDRLSVIRTRYRNQT